MEHTRQIVHHTQHHRQNINLPTSRKPLAIKTIAIIDQLSRIICMHLPIPKRILYYI